MCVIWPSIDVKFFGHTAIMHNIKVCPQKEDFDIELWSINNKKILNVCLLDEKGDIKFENNRNLTVNGL